jgi:hypothetical protein
MRGISVASDVSPQLPGPVTTVFAKRYGGIGVREDAIHGWAETVPGRGRIEVFKSSQNGRWLNREEYNLERHQISLNANGRCFTSRKNFRLAAPMLNAIAYLQKSVRQRVKVTFNGQHWIEIDRLTMA